MECEVGLILNMWKRGGDIPVDHLRMAMFCASSSFKISPLPVTVEVSNEAIGMQKQMNEMGRDGDKVRGRG